MINTLCGKLNSRGFVKSLEVLYKGHIMANELRIYVSPEDINKVDTKESVREWLSSITKTEDLNLENMNYELQTSEEDGLCTIVLELMSFEDVDRELFNTIMNSLIAFMEPDKIVQTMTKVGENVDSVEVSSDMLHTSLTLNLSIESYMKYVDGKEDETEGMLYSDENLESVLTNLLADSNIEIPPYKTVFNMTFGNSMCIVYRYNPAEYDNEILQIFDYLTVDDFDGGENVEDLFMDVNKDENVPEEFKIKSDFIPTREDFKIVADIFKSLKMDMDMEVDEMTVEQETVSEGLKTKLTVKGLKFRGKLN